MQDETLPCLEVFVLKPAPGTDLAIGLDVTLASLRAAQVTGYRLKIVLGFMPPPGVDAGLLALRVQSDLVADNRLALSAHATEAFYLAIEAGQAFPWSVAPRAVFQHGRAVFFGQDSAQDAQTRKRAVLLSGIAVPSALVPPDSATIYSTQLAERALVMLHSMHGEALSGLRGALTSEPALYAMMNDDRMHCAHIFVQNPQSPLHSITEVSSDTANGERLYARLRGR